MPRMTMSFRQGLFVVRTYSREDGAVAKAAGARWHGPHDNPRFGSAADCPACQTGLPLKDYWWFPRSVAARAIQLEAVADDSALEALRPAAALLEVSRSSGEAPALLPAAEVMLEREVPVPPGRRLYPYQKTGVLFMSENKEGSLLADEPGVGKTPQVLALINLERIGRTLIVVPASLRLNWLREAVVWLTEPTRIHVITDSEKTAANIRPGPHVVTSGPRLPADLASCPSNLIVIVNYDRVRDPALLKELQACEWDLLVADEAHFLKNSRALRTIAMLGKEEKGKLVVQGLRQRAKRFIAMTGTPLPNRPVEMWPILHAVAPRTFQDFWAFAKRYCGAQKIWISPRVGMKWDFAGSSNLGELQEVLRSTCMVRRLKTDVLKDLPAKVRQIIALPYEDYADVVKAEYDGFDEEESEVEGYVESVISEGTPEAYEEAATALGKMGKLAFGDMSRARQRLALKKLPAVIEICDNRLEEMGEAGKIIIFAHHHAVIEKLEKHYGKESVVVYGETSALERDAAVQAFQTDPAVRVFIGSIGAAGVGLTLTAASTVVFAEIDWVPGNVTQAEDRAHRIGQKDSVTVLHIVVERSLDARMVQLLVAKADVADQALDRDRPALEIPTNAELARRDEALERRIQEKKARALQYPPVSDFLRQRVQEMMAVLTDLDMDHASVVNGAGFSKLDGGIGRRLAFAKELGPAMLWGIGVKLANKYRRQVPSLAAEIAEEAARLREGWSPPPPLQLGP